VSDVSNGRFADRARAAAGVEMTGSTVPPDVGHVGRCGSEGIGEMAAVLHDQPGSANCIYFDYLSVADGRDDIERFPDGLELVPPGVTDAAAWRPGPGPVPVGPPGRPALFYAGIGRVPRPPQ